MASVYTKTGDQGETSLYGGSRVLKCSDRVKAYGAVDEVNALLGVVKCKLPDQVYKDLFEIIQEKLFIIGGELSSDDKGSAKLGVRLTEEDVRFLEKAIDHFECQLPKNSTFLTPGTSELSGYLHFARTVVRRAERSIIESCQSEYLNSAIGTFMNRLSDLMFVLSKIEFKPNLVCDSLTLGLAEKMVKVCIAKAEQIKVPVIIAIVDGGGNLLHMSRMENALLGSIDIAINKAFTANAFKMPTGTLGELSKPGDPLYGIQHTNESRVVIFGGGFPIVINGEIVGAIGVSGGSVEEDETICKEALKLLEK